MEAFFLVCFLFGALFIAASLLLGVAGTALHLELGGHDLHLGHEAHLGQHGGSTAHGQGHGHEFHVGHQEAAEQAGQGSPGQSGQTSHAQSGLPLLNLSSLLAFVTWFGAAGYLLLRFAGWPLLGVLAVAIVAGLAGALIIAFVLAKIMAGEREMDPRDYVLEGTIARVTVGIPAGGVGEIVFSKGGVRRSEAARGLDGRAVPRDTEVVIIDYARGVAAVEPWDELVSGHEAARET